jgi:hypothetical protein
MLFREAFAVYCENHKEQTNVICERSVALINQMALTEPLGFKILILIPINQLSPIILKDDNKTLQQHTRHIHKDSKRRRENIISICGEMGKLIPPRI